MVTVKKLLGSGFKAVCGDTVGGVKINESQASSINSSNSSNLEHYLYVSDLAWRKNTGVMPVGDDCLVEIECYNGDKRVVEAGRYCWDNDYCLDTEIYKWKPSLKHLEQQMTDNQETKTALEMSERDIESYADDCDVERELKESEEVVWGGGDIAIHEGHEVLVIDWHPHHPLLVVEGGNGFFATSSDKLSKPETPEQKVARERMESAYDLYLESKESMEPCMSKTTFIHTDNKEKELWLRIVDKTGYRKQ